jgi:hypothetical protein
MTLFGRTLGAEEIASLVFMSMTLVLWLFAFRGERRWARWFHHREAERRALREAAEKTEPREDPGAPRGPWS